MRTASIIHSEKSARIKFAAHIRATSFCSPRRCHLIVSTSAHILAAGCCCFCAGVRRAHKVAERVFELVMPGTMAAGLMVRKRAHKWSAKSQKHFILLSLLLLDYTLNTSWLGETFLHHRSKNTARARDQKETKSYCCEILPRHSFPLYVHQTEQQQHTTSHVNAALPAIWLKQIWKSRTRRRRATFPSPPKLHEEPLPLQLFDGRAPRLERNFSSSRCINSLLARHIWMAHARARLLMRCDNFHIRGCIVLRYKLEDYLGATHGISSARLT